MFQELCRQRMSAKTEGPEPLSGIVGTLAQRLGSQSEPSPPAYPHSTHSSTSSWSEEPVQTNMDISTGHMILSYMEDHLLNKDRLEQEWKELEAYQPDVTVANVSNEKQNQAKNRSKEVVPYDPNRVTINEISNQRGGNYINASFICDHDPRNPAYVATQAPFPDTVSDFWQMVWEQGSVVIVNLAKVVEAGDTKSFRYWPENGSEVHHNYEIHLVSEHIWCEDYLVRSFYLKNLKTQETRTVTQFHFLTWEEESVPSSSKALLEFRRKVNKSYRGRSCPIVVHCSDGGGRTGTYCLLDMVLNRISKGVKEIDIAAALEHLRDQRMKTIRTMEQFEFVLACVAEEVQAVLKALPQ